MGAVVLIGWLVALSVYDIRHRRLPNYLTLPGAVLLLVAAALAGRGAAAALGAVALFGVYAAVHLAAPAAMGAGDVKLAIGLGALTGAFGWAPWVLAAVGAPLLTGLYATVVAARRQAVVLPHGPSMCLASAAAVAAPLTAGC